MFLFILIFLIPFSYFLRAPYGRQINPLTLNDIRDLEEHIYKYPKRSELKSITRLGRIFDVVIIGDGPISEGACYESVLRGYKTACINKYDLGSEEHPTPTHIFAGGWNGFQSCLLGAQSDGCLLSAKAIKQRPLLMDWAPHLTQMGRFSVPIRGGYQDSLAAKAVSFGWNVFEYGVSLVTFSPLWPEFSHFVPKKTDESSFIGSIEIPDILIQPRRILLSLSMSAIKNGAVAMGYMEVIGFDIKGDKIEGVQVKDLLTGETWSFSGKVFLNLAQGSYQDEISQLAESSIEKKYTKKRKISLSSYCSQHYDQHCEKPNFSISRTGLVTLNQQNWFSFFSSSKEALQIALSEAPSLNTKKHEKRKNLIVQTPIIGAQGYSDFLKDVLSESYQLPLSVTEHLSQTYGGLSLKVMDIAWERNLFQQIHPLYPYLLAEVVYMVRHEYALQAMDVMTKRFQFDKLQDSERQDIFRKIISQMAIELHMDESWKLKQLAEYSNEKKQSLKNE